MRGFIDLTPCFYLVTISFGFLLLQKVSQAHFSHHLEPFSLQAGAASAHATFVSKKRDFWTRHLVAFRAFGFPCNRPTKEVGSNLGNPCAIREVF